ncbi:MAG: aspartate-semialdehyde dehydrogenase [Candidatus Thermoplasmatota archaeon]|nr:aspartate-semialdehyde dehydrogenase [Candidatus Thermoplasmatota archaeon]
MRVRKVAILGASGLVAQRFQQRLSNHPWFEIVAVYGSHRTAGMKLEELEWHLPEPRPDIPSIEIRSMDSLMDDDDFEVVFSALPSDVAIEVERPLAEAGYYVFSNASTHRMDADVPLIVADLNPHHLLPLTNSERDGGFIACSTNCTIVPVALVLKPLWDFIGLNNVTVRTEQSLSGGGLDVLTSARASGLDSDEIPGEAEKMHEECLSLLGRAQSNGVRPANLPIQIECKRVMREYGHIVHVHCELYKQTEENEIIEWIERYQSRPQVLNLPSAPQHPIQIVNQLIGVEYENPSSNLQAGMEIRMTDLIVEGKQVSFSAWSENTIRGAAGGTVLLAELALAEGLLGD